MARPRVVPEVARRPGRDLDLRTVEELRLLERAQAALIEDPALALALADEHARRFSDRLLDQEREVIAVAALDTLGRAAEARARARAFIERFPGSAHEARMRAVLGRSAPDGL